jgi:hypothetical protein
MAMRDPGMPGRNPFFEHDADEIPEEPVGAPPWIAPTGGADPLRTLAGLVDALQEVQPEATEHLVTAAHELVLAVKCVVDATEAVLAAQRANAAPAPPERDLLLREDADPEPEPEAPPRSSGVRRIDLA